MQDVFNSVINLVTFVFVMAVLAAVMYATYRFLIKQGGGRAFCLDCQRNVTTTKKFNWLVFIFLCGFCYIPFYLAQGQRCPMCNGTSFGKPKANV